MKMRSKKTALLAMLAGACLPLFGGCLDRVLLEIAGESVAALIPNPFVDGGNNGADGG